jgi:hypothetical protein
VDKPDMTQNVARYTQLSTIYALLDKPFSTGLTVLQDTVINNENKLINVYRADKSSKKNIYKI